MKPTAKVSKSAKIIFVFDTLENTFMYFVSHYCNIKIIILSLIINFYQKDTNNENLARIFNFKDLSY